MSLIKVYQYAEPLPAGHTVYTVAQAAIGEWKKVTLERFGHVIVRVEPWDRNYHLMVEWERSARDEDIYRPADPDSWIPDAYKPIMADAIQQWAFETFEANDYILMNVKFFLLGGSYDIINSTEGMMRIAAAMAARQAVETAGLVQIRSTSS